MRLTALLHGRSCSSAVSSRRENCVAFCVASVRPGHLSDINTLAPPRWLHSTPRIPGFQAVRRLPRRCLHRGSLGFGACRSPFQPGKAPFPAPAGQSHHRTGVVSTGSTRSTAAPESLRQHHHGGLHQQEPGVPFMPFNAGSDILSGSEVAGNRTDHARNGRSPGNLDDASGGKCRGTHRQQAHSYRRGTLATP